MMWATAWTEIIGYFLQVLENTIHGFMIAECLITFIILSLQQAR